MMAWGLLALALAAPQPIETPTVRPGLEPLAFLVGHCWRGELPRGEVDIQCFETVYGGQHIRARHEVTDGRGVYSGETFYSAEGAGGVAFTYFNSLGGVSHGTLRADADGLHVGDEQYRGPNGREMSLRVAWHPMGQDAYQVTTSSADVRTRNGTVLYRRVDDEVSVREERGPDGSLTLIHEAIVDAPVAAVWQALATAEGWRGWAVPVAWSSPGEPDVLETSYDQSAQPGDASTIKHQVLARVPGRMIAFRTIKAPEGFPHFNVFKRTTNVFELEPVGEARTRVRTIGAGYPDDGAGRQLMSFFREGNRISLRRLQQRFTGGPIDWSEIRNPRLNESRSGEDWVEQKAGEGVGN